jgi:hypothetical protein
VALEDRQRLEEFAESVYQLLGEVVREQPQWLPPELRDDYVRAWQDAEADLGRLRQALLPEARRSAAEAPPPDQGSLDAALAASGLVGSQLRLKLRGYYRALDRFRAALAPRRLRRVLRWGDVILGSLAGVVGGAEALKELKEAVEAGVEDQEEGQQPF